MNVEYDPQVQYDRDGNPFVLSSCGQRIRLNTPKKTTSSGFTTYDTSGGHCALCGSLTCNGGCFK